MRAFRFLFLLMLPSLVGAQVPSLPGGSAMVPAMPETLRAGIVLPAGWPQCRGIEIPADSASFGQPVDVLLWFDDADLPLPDQPLECTAPWLQIGALAKGEEPESVVLEARVHALDFFQLQVGDALGPIVPMRQTGIDLQSMAPVRMPRLWATRWWVLLPAALVVGLLIWGGLGLWWRRRRLEALAQWQPAPPAWLEAAPRLRHLLAEDREAAANTHAFCDELAGIARRFLAGRYLVPATEMTGPEVLARLRELGFPHGSVSRLTRLVEELDNHRYDPLPPSTVWCRQQASMFYEAMSEVRIIPRYIPVDPAVLLEAEQAWAWLGDPQNLPRDAVAGVEGGV